MDFMLDCVFAGFFLATGAWLFIEALEGAGEIIRKIQDKIFQKKRK